MFPSFDSWTLVELESHLTMLNRLGIGAIIVSVLFGIWWAGYQDAIRDKIQGHKDSMRAEKDAAIEAGVAEARKLIPETTGLIVPGTGETPKFDYGDDKRPDRGPRSIPNPELGAEILLGDNVTYSESFPFVVIAQGEEDLIVIDRDDSGWLFSGKFFNKAGKIVCEFVKNQYHLHPANHFRVDKKPNRLTVYDDEAKQIFDVEFVNAKLIRLTGSFCVRGGERIVIESKWIAFRGAKIASSAGRILGFGTGPNKGRVTVVQLPPLPFGFGVDNIPTKGRAFLTVQGPIRLDVTAGRPIDISVIARNLGELPAMTRGCRVFLATSRPTDDIYDSVEDFEELPAKLMEMPPLPYGEAYGGQLGRFAPLTSEMVDMVHARLIVVRVFGTIWYTDEKGTSGQSVFCGRLNPTTGYLEPEFGWNRML